MTIYLDIEFLLNFCYDFLILITVDMTLKRNAPKLKILVSSIIGASSLFLLFIPLNAFILFILKILVSIIMVLIAYGFKDIKYSFNNIFYLYMVSVILGGFLYLLKTQLSLKQYGLAFINEGLSINYLFLLIIAPLILGAYIYQNKKIKRIYNYIYDVKIVFKDNRELKCQGFLDSGNKLKDPITNKYIVLLENKAFKNTEQRPIYVPFKALNNEGLLECFSINYLEIANKKFNNYLVGITSTKFNIEGVSCLLNNKLLEEI